MTQVKNPQTHVGTNEDSHSFHQNIDVSEGTLSESALIDEERSHCPGSWDQFDGNKHLISTASTYDEQFYTTPIPKNIPKEWMERVRHITQERETPDTGHAEAEDEETQHCAVRRQKITQEDALAPKAADKSYTQSRSERRSFPPTAKHVTIERGHQNGLASVKTNTLDIPFFTPARCKQDHLRGKNTKWRRVSGMPSGGMLLAKSAARRVVTSILQSRRMSPR